MKHESTTIHDSYPYGFLISFDEEYMKKHSPNGYTLFDKDYKLSYDKSTSFLTFSSGYVCVTILGDIYSTVDIMDKKFDPAEKLVNCLLKSEQDFFKLLKTMWGRFLIIYTNTINETFILTDATGMRNVFYTSNCTLACSSHPYILGSEKEASPFPIKYGYPGNLTPLKNIKILTPNTRICLNNGKISRFFPGLMELEKESDNSVSAVADYMIKSSGIALKNVLEKKKESLCVSLTAGIDSRITLALLKLSIPEHISKIKFVTYKNNKEEFCADIDVSKLIAEKYHLNHTTFTEYDFIDKELVKKTKQSSYYYSSAKMLSGFKNALKSRHIHIRSNIYEIGRAYYRTFGVILSILKKEVENPLVDIYIKNIEKHENIKAFYDETANRELAYKVFNDFFDESDFHKASQYFDSLDLFYWEHRMGTWVSHIYLESDFVFDTVSIPNNWIMLEKLLKIPEDDRIQAKVFKEIIKKADDFLHRVPINPRTKNDLDNFLTKEALNAKESNSSTLQTKIEQLNTAFLIKSQDWFTSDKRKKDLLTFSNSEINLNIKFLENEYLYITSGNTDLKEMCTHKDQYDISFLNTFKITVNINYDSNITCDLFVLQFSDTEKVSGSRYNIDNGHSIVIDKKHNDAKYLKLAIRIQSNITGKSSITLKEVSICEAGDADKSSLKKNTSKNIIKIDTIGLRKNESKFLKFKPRKDTDQVTLKLPIDWSMDPFNDRNWCYSLHAWKMMDNLLLDYQKNDNNVLLFNALEIVEDWYEYTLYVGSSNFAWYDMSTGLRAMKLAYLYDQIVNCKKIDYDALALTNILQLHIENLKTQKIALNNHGIFQIHGLMLLAWVLDDKESMDYALKKMKTTFSNQFFKDGFHVENSDEYHWFVLKTFEDFLICKPYQAISTIKTTLINAQECKNWAVFPNERSLMIGDTGDPRRSDGLTIADDFETQMRFFEDSGYFFVGSGFSVPAKDASMLFFQTAYQNKAHRHGDDFNVLLFEFGLNILVDAGKHSYEYESDERKYVVSSRAHNVLVIDNKDYDIKSKDFYKSMLKKMDQHENIYYTHTEINRSDIGVIHARHIFYEPQKFLIVVDKVQSEEEHQFDQFWHFHESLEIHGDNHSYNASINDNRSLNITTNSYYLNDNKLELNNTNTDVGLIKGETTPQMQGWRSLRYKTFIENFALQNSIQAKKALLVTKFSFSSSKTDVNDLMYDFIDGHNDLHIKLTSVQKNINLEITI